MAFTESDIEMARSNLLKDIASLPWPIGILTAGLTWISLRYVAPSMLIDSGNLLRTELASVAHRIAPIFSSLFLFAGAVSWWRSRDRRRLLDSRTDLGSIRALPWDRFEQLVGEAFRRRGYQVQENTVAGADRGIDLVLTRAAETVLVQCKRWDKPIGVPIVRELLGAVTAEGATSGVLVVSSRFTDPAKAFARTNNIELVDGAELQQMIHDVQHSIPPSKAPDINSETSRLDSGCEQPAAVPSASTACPLCGASMTRRTARRGARAGTEFLGCSTFPDCRGTRKLD